MGVETRFQFGKTIDNELAKRGYASSTQSGHWYGYIGGIRSLSQSRDRLLDSLSVIYSDANDLYLNGPSDLWTALWGGIDRLWALCRTRGCTPESQKFPSAQLQSRHERIQVDELAVSLEGVMPVQQDVPPGRWRHLRDQRQRLGIASCLVLRQQQGQDRRVVEDDRVADQPGALVADLDFDVGAAGQFLLPTDLGDGRA